MKKINTKAEAVKNWIEDVEDGNQNAIIVKDNEGEYFAVTSRSNVMKSDTVVYAYGGYVGSDANMEVDDIASRIKI